MPVSQHCFLWVLDTWGITCGCFPGSCWEVTACPDSYSKSLQDSAERATPGLAEVITNVCNRSYVNTGRKGRLCTTSSSAVAGDAPWNKGTSSSWGSNKSLHGGCFRICMGRKMCSHTGSRLTQGIRCQVADYLWQQPRKVCTNPTEEND